MFRRPQQRIHCGQHTVDSDQGEKAALTGRPIVSSGAAHGSGGRLVAEGLILVGALHSDEVS